MILSPIVHVHLTGWSWMAFQNTVELAQIPGALSAMQTHWIFHSDLTILLQDLDFWLSGHLLMNFQHILPPPLVVIIVSFHLNILALHLTLVSVWRMLIPNHGVPCHCLQMREHMLLPKYIVQTVTPTAPICLLR